MILRFTGELNVMGVFMEFLFTLGFSLKWSLEMDYPANRLFFCSMADGNTPKLQ
jgi:hypothetical protein